METIIALAALAYAYLSRDRAATVTVDGHKYKLVGDKTGSGAPTIALEGVDAND